MDSTALPGPTPPQPGQAAGYTLAELLTRNRRRQYVTKDGRFQLRQAGNTEFYYWHELTKKDGKTVVGNPISGPGGSYSTFFSDKAAALAMLNKICADYPLTCSLYQ